MQQAVARDHGKVRARADHGQDGDDGNSKEFGHVGRNRKVKVRRFWMCPPSLKIDL
jgi:hypothetical protein